MWPLHDYFIAFYPQIDRPRKYLHACQLPDQARVSMEVQMCSQQALGLAQHLLILCGDDYGPLALPAVLGPWQQAAHLHAIAIRSQRQTGSQDMHKMHLTQMQRAKGQQPMAASRALTVQRHCWALKAGKVQNKGAARSLVCMSITACLGRCCHGKSLCVPNAQAASRKKTRPLPRSRRACMEKL